MEIKNITMIGMGAVGAVIGSQLNKVEGVKLSCIADAERKARYEKNGIRINGVPQNFKWILPEEAEPSDLIIIATKNLQLETAIKQIKNAVGPDTMILSILNGIQSERDISKVYGEEKVLYSFVISLNSININGEMDCSDYGTLVFGEKDNSKSPRVEAIIDLLTKAGIRYKNPENIQLELWKKFLINVTFNTLSAITRSPYGGFRSEIMQKLARTVGNEVIQVAHAENIPLTEDMLEADIQLMCGHDPNGKTSMLQDMEAKRFSENEWFCGTVIRLGKEHNIPTTYCEFLCDLVKGTEVNYKV